MARIAAIGTSLPEHVLEQSQLRDLARQIIPGDAGEATARVFDNACIDRRYLARPVEWYLAPHGHRERAQVFEEVGLALAMDAAGKALAEASLQAADVDAVLFVSTTGTSTPSLDARLCNRMGMRSDVLRVPVWGLGCAGGVGGLNRAAELCQRIAGDVLLISMELCSINLDVELVMGGGTAGKKGAVAAAVFGDGCAAVVLRPDGDGARHMAGHSHLFPDTEWVMGWEVTDRNLEVVLSPEIPDIVRRHMPGLVAGMLQRHGIDRPHAWILHPGGAKVVDAFQESLGLRDDERHWTDRVLAAHGNMSSPTVLFCLKDCLDSDPGPDRDLLLAALGPGFASEMAWVRT